MRRTVITCDKCNNEIGINRGTHLEIDTHGENHRRARKEKNLHLCEDCKELFSEFIYQAKGMF